MRLSDQVRRHGGFAALCLLIPVAAMLVTYVGVHDKPNLWRTQRTLALPSVIIDKNPGAVTLWIASFREALDSPRLISGLAKAQGLSKHDLDDELRAHQVGRSAQISVSFDADGSTGGQKVVDAAIQRAVDVVALPQRQALSAATAARADAAKVRDADRAAVSAVLGGTGIVNPPTELARARADLASARADLAVAESLGSARGPVLRASIPDLEKHVSDLEALAVAYQPVADKLDDAQGQLDGAVDRETTARAELDSLLHPLPIGIATVVRRPADRVILRSVLVAGAIGLAVAAGLVLLRIAGEQPGPFTPGAAARR
jgi:hypothetical protein